MYSNSYRRPHRQLDSQRLAKKKAVFEDPPHHNLIGNQGRGWQWGFRRAALSAIFGLSCIVKAEFCLSCIVQGIWPWSVKVKIMLVVHRARTLSSCTVQRFRKEKTQKVKFPGGFAPLDPPLILKLSSYRTHETTVIDLHSLGLFIVVNIQGTPQLYWN